MPTREENRLIRNCHSDQRPGYRVYSWLLALIALVMGIAACTTPNKMAYLRDLSLNDRQNLSKATYQFEMPIQKNDQLWITIGGTNLDDLELLNSGSGMIQGGNMNQLPGNSGTQVMGYLVESDGMIKLPYLNKVKAEGLTRLQLEDFITDKMKDYTKNPVVNVRFLNYRVTVIGAVRSPGSFSIPTERITVLEAVGLAGDLTVFGKRENVLVIREVNGERTFAWLNLSSKELLNSPYYYLRTNDIVYVEPIKASSINRERVPQYVGMAAGVLSLIVSIIYISQN